MPAPGTGGKKQPGKKGKMIERGGTWWRQEGEIQSTSGEFKEHGFGTRQANSNLLTRPSYLDFYSLPKLSFPICKLGIINKKYISS